MDNFDKDENLLNWQKIRKNILQMMAKLVMRIFVIPATSVISERAFNVSGRVNEERRSCFKAITMDALLFLQNFQKQK